MATWGLEATSWPLAVFVQSAVALSRLAPVQKRVGNEASLRVGKNEAE